MMNNIQQNRLYFVSLKEIRRIRKQVSSAFLLCEILADIFRLNTLYMVMKAGSGHLGSSFSSTDIITWLWTQEMKNPNDKKRKIPTFIFLPRVMMCQRSIPF